MCVKYGPDSGHLGILQIFISINTISSENFNSVALIDLEIVQEVGGYIGGYLTLFQSRLFGLHLRFSGSKFLINLRRQFRVRKTFCTQAFAEFVVFSFCV